MPAPRPCRSRAPCQQRAHDARAHMMLPDCAQHTATLPSIAMLASRHGAPPPITYNQDLVQLHLLQSAQRRHSDQKSQRSQRR